jgi:hypothetical protein
MKIHAGHIELAVAKLLDHRVYTIVPNVSYGLGLNHECDMLALDTKGRFTEIEIKISASDLKADFKKVHGHRSKIISRLVYAMPKELCEKHGHLIPKCCGIIGFERVTKKQYSGDSSPLISYNECQWIRQVKHVVDQLPSDKQIRKFMTLGCMRIWSLKANNYQLKKRLYENKIITA